MRTSLSSVATLVLTLIIVSLAHAAAPAPDLGPVVVKSVPETLANDVDPATTRIAVTFDRKMRDGSWSWTGGGETYPQVAGKIAYDAERTTCTLPVKLEAGKVYWIGINSPSHRNFKSIAGKPAQRYVVCFATRSADGKATPIPDEMLNRAKGINGAVGKAEPIVVKTMPKAFKADVPATVKEVSVTFDQAMMNGSWSWTGGGDTYPETTGKISYGVDGKTCRLPVKLVPGKVYWIGINSPSHQNFQNRANAAARR